MTLRALSFAPRFSRVARFTLVSILLGVSLLISANAHAARLGVSKIGSGTVTSSPAGINCGTTCKARYTSGTSVTLTAAAASGYSFSGWGGACSGTSATCKLTITDRRRVTATFSQNVVISTLVNYALTVSKSGSGTVTSSPAGINCGTSCSASYASGANVTLTAAAASGYSFSGWIGACSGTSASCTVSINAARSVAATFNQNIALSAPDTTIQCSDSGLAATDLSGQCRSSTATPGALEAIDASTLPIP
ncbi:MAG: InlB B-repeat-containing protein [Sulfuricaulis sp.]|uniref:InlB B-repeat-containing protein n=1 Tax=Sulfuricaulis sp. TaxID=2003553 RepID=UPI003C3148AF